MKNILILDDDLGFLYWLGEVLVGARHQPWPACNVSDAISVVGRNRSVPLDLLIVNPSLRGASSLITQFRRKRARLKVIALGVNNGSFMWGVDAWRERARPNDPLAKQKWLRAIDLIFSSSTRAA